MGLTWLKTIIALFPEKISFAANIALIFALAFWLLQKRKRLSIYFTQKLSLAVMRWFIYVFLIVYTISRICEILIPAGQGMLDITAIRMNASAISWKDFIWQFMVILAFEAVVFGIRFVCTKKAEFPKAGIERMEHALLSRWTGAFDDDGRCLGSFRTQESVDSSHELWVSGQAVLALSRGFPESEEMAGIIDGFIGYLENSSAVLNGDCLIWETCSCTSGFIIPGIWALIGLNYGLCNEKISARLSEARRESAGKMICNGVRNMMDKSNRDGGWAPIWRDVGTIESCTLPTVMAIWFLSLCRKCEKKLKLTEEGIACIDQKMKEAIEWVIKKYDKREHLWRNTDDSKASTVALTLFVYFILCETSSRGHECLKILHLQEFLTNCHEHMMSHVDYCLGKKIDDVETDGPYDNVCPGQSNSSIPITFYDWLPISIMAVNASKAAGLYRAKHDGIRSLRLKNLVLENSEMYPSWHTYRLSLMLIGLSSSGEKQIYTIDGEE